MGKTKTHKSTRMTSSLKNIKKTVNKTLPIVDKGIKTIGSNAKHIAKVSVPIVENGVSIVYETMATGVDLGVKEAKKMSSKMSKRKRSKSKHYHNSSLFGGRKSRHGRKRR